MNVITLALLLALTPAAWQNPQGSAPTTTAPNAQSTSPNTQNAPLSQKGIERIIKEVHHELVMLPFYGVFDNLAYKVSPDGTVTLLGQVSRPTLKSDAENVVKRIERARRAAVAIIRRWVLRCGYPRQSATWAGSLAWNLNDIIANRVQHQLAQTMQT